MSGGLRISETITAANPVEEYRLSLRNVPVYGLRRAYVKAEALEYENINRAFIPCRRFAALASAECRLIREDRIRKQETLRAIEDSISRTLPSSHGLMDLRGLPARARQRVGGKGLRQGPPKMSTIWNSPTSPNRGNCLPVSPAPGN